MRRLAKRLAALFLAGPGTVLSVAAFGRNTGRDGLRRVLVIDTASVGDMVCALPALSALSRALPEAEISFAAAPRTRPFINALFPGREVLCPDADGMVSALRRMRAEKFDLALVLNFSVFNSFLALFCGARAGAGYLFRRDLVESRALVPAFVRKVDRAALHLSGLRLEAVRAFVPEAALCGKDDFAALARLVRGAKKNPRRVLLCPFSKWRSKNWTKGGFAALGRRIAELRPDAEIVIEGTAADRDRARELAGLIGRNCRAAAGENDIVGLVRHIGASALLVSVDSAPVHIADALGVPLLALYGPTPPLRCGPRSGGPDSVVVANPAAAGLDYEAGDWARDGNARLMRELSEAEVLAALDVLLGRVFGG